MDILLSSVAARHFDGEIARTLGKSPYRLLTPDDTARSDAQIAFVSRDVTGRSTKHELTDDTRRFYDTMLAAPRLRWVHAHSAGIDRPVFVELLRRGVRVTTSSGANARTVAHAALAGLLALARRLPSMMEAQREHAWRPLLADAAPPDLANQTAVVVGYGAIGRKIAALLDALEMNVIVVRRDATAADSANRTPRMVAFDALDSVLPQADWLILACPLTPQTARLIDARRLSLLPARAHFINVARGEIVVEPDLVDALRDNVLAGAYLDVFAHEPLNEASPLWDLPNVIVTPHTAGHSDGHYAAVGRIWLDNLARWTRGESLVNEVQGG
ncbi:MAG TPA: D-2-hydroxyacid dehydrogenase [Paraburkholderia sp.]|nr:D-2-hydroxyacid dehydrogenase [Paraburkholderia sp.]